MSSNTELSKGDRKELKQDLGKSKIEVFREYDCHQDIEKTELWVKYVRGWTDAGASTGNVDSDSISTMLEMNSLAKKVHNEEISLHEGKKRLEKVIN